MQGAQGNENEIGTAVIESAIKVHSALGPGMLESAYQACLFHELTARALSVRSQVLLPLKYADVIVEAGYRIDLLVANRVVVEIKSLETVLPVHRSQLLSYLRLGGYRLGYLLNFNVARMRDGITRRVSGLPDPAASAFSLRPLR